MEYIRQLSGWNNELCPMTDEYNSNGDGTLFTESEIEMLKETYDLDNFAIEYNFTF